MVSYPLYWINLFPPSNITQNDTKILVSQNRPELYNENDLERMSLGACDHLEREEHKCVNVSTYPGLSLTIYIW